MTDFVLAEDAQELVSSDDDSNSQASIPVNYTLDLRKVPLGELPKEWEGPNNAMVNNLGGSKCLTNNTNRTPATLTITNHFNQPGDFVLNLTLTTSQISGQIVDENSHAISFTTSYTSRKFGDSSRGSDGSSPRNVPPKYTVTITRRGNVLSMTGDYFTGEGITIRSDTFKSLTGFSISIPSTSSGLFAFSVRPLSH